MAVTMETGVLQIIGRRVDAYDFNDTETNERVVGETHVLVCWNPATLSADAVKIKNSALGLFDEIKQGDHVAEPYAVRLTVEPFARGNRVTLTAVGLVPA